MTRRELLRFSVAIPPLARLQGRESPFWQTKDRSAWSERQIDEFITNSPWAKEVNACTATGRKRSGEQFGAIVRWESARPVLDALDTVLPSAFENHYVISVSGIPPRRSAEELDDKIADLKRISFLQVNGKGSSAPDIIWRMPSRNTINLLFGFPHERLKISAEDGDVTFGTEVAPCRIRAIFALADMIYRGELAL
jgi:hypothetical protein